MRGISVPTSAALMSKFPFDPLMDPKKTRHEDLHGDRDLIYYLNPRDPSFTHYMGNHSGKQVGEKERAEIIDTFTISAMQLPSPDPVILSKFQHYRN